MRQAPGAQGRAVTTGRVGCGEGIPERADQSSVLVPQQNGLGRLEKRNVGVSSLTTQTNCKFLKRRRLLQPKDPGGR